MPRGDHETIDRSSNRSYNPLTRSYNHSLEVFRGSQQPLSSYYPVELHEDGKIFPTAEHLYQYRKAISLDLPEDADAISLAENPFRAMSLGYNLDAQCDIIHIDEWYSTKTKVMRDVIRMKYDSSQDFRNILENSNDKVLVEATSNMYWASGLNPKSTANTPIDEWPGENKLGDLLMELRTMKAVPRVLKLPLSQMQLPLWMT